MRYDEYIRSPRWNAVRRWALERADYRCQVCNGPQALQVHHRTYENLGHEHPGDVIVLCGSCHELYHFPNDGPLVQEIVDFITRTTSLRAMLADPGGLLRIPTLINQIQNPSRREVMRARFMDALKALEALCS